MRAGLRPGARHPAGPWRPFATVDLAAPLDAAASLERFRRWGDDLLERWDGTTLLATVGGSGGAPAGRPTAYAARVVGTVGQPSLELAAEDGADRQAEAAIVHHVARLFVAAPFPLSRLAAADPVVASLEARYPGLRPVLQRDVLTALVRSISAQQVNLTWAATIRRRLATSYGVEHRVGEGRVWSLDPARLGAATIDDLRALQLTGRKAISVRACAAAALGGELDLAAIEALDDETLIERMTLLPGIGRWTAEWLLARTLGRPRVVAGDLGVRKAVGAAYLGWRPGRGQPPDEAAVRAATAHWGAAAGVAQQLLLHWLGDGLPEAAMATAAEARSEAG